MDHDIRHPLSLLSGGLFGCGTLSSLGGLVLLAAQTPEPLFPVPPMTQQLMVPGAILGLLVAWGAYLIYRREAYWYARWTCILAMLPCGVGFPLGLPIGLWGLSVLARPEVRQAFRMRAAYYHREHERALEEFDADLRDHEESPS